MRKIAVALLLIALSCAAPFRRGAEMQDGPITFQTILAGSHSLADTFSVQLITNEKDWQNTWIIAKGNEEPLPAIPTVNFSHQYVIAAFMGERTSSGYRIEISSIEKKGPMLTVHVKLYETPGMLPVITNPFTLVRVPRGSYKLDVVQETIK